MTDHLKTSKEQVADQFLEQADADAGKLSFEKPHPRDYGGVIMDCANGPRWCLPDASRRELFYRALADYWRYRAVAADEPFSVGDEVEWRGHKGVVVSTEARVSVCLNGKHTHDLPIAELKRASVTKDAGECGACDKPGEH